MSEFNKDVFGLFLQTQQTYEEAVEKAKKEAGAPQIDRYRIAEDGDYSIRVLPLAPYIDENGDAKPMERKGYEYPVHQLFIKIQKPSKNGKKQGEVTVPIIRTTDKGVGFNVGYSVDLIDKYVEIAKSYGDKEIDEQLGKGSYYGGLKWQYVRCMYILDMKKNRKGPLLYQASFAQYKSLDDAKLAVWEKLKAKKGGENQLCPISGFSGAFPVDIRRTMDNSKVKYSFTVDTLSDKDDLSEDELKKLLDLPRIPDLIYRYTRYQFEATLVFLEQMDEKLDINVCAQPDFQEAVEKLKGELPADDTSHFDIATAGAGSNGKDNGEVTIDSLWADYDAIAAQDLDSSSSEYKALREKIQQFVADRDLDVRCTHSKNNEQLLNEIEEALNESDNQVAPKNDREKQDEKPVDEKRRARRTMPAQDDQDDEQDDVHADDDPDEGDEEEQPAEERQEEEQAPKRRRRM